MSEVYTYVVHIDADTFDRDQLIEELIFDGLTHVNEHSGHTIYSVEAHEANVDEMYPEAEVLHLKFED